MLHHAAPGFLVCFIIADPIKKKSQLSKPLFYLFKLFLLISPVKRNRSNTNYFFRYYGEICDIPSDDIFMYPSAMPWLLIYKNHSLWHGIQLGDLFLKIV